MRRHGFSLGELVVAIGVVSLPILFTIGLLTTNLSLQTKSGGLVGSSQVAEALLEEWKARPYGELKALVGDPPLLTQRTAGGRQYDCAFTVSPLQPPSANPAGSVLQLEVTVGWREQSGLGEAGGRTEQVQRSIFRTVVSPSGAI